MIGRETLTSTANPRVKAAAALRERRARDRTGLTLVDGARELRRALDGGVTVEEAFIEDAALAGEDARAALDRLVAVGATVHRVSEPVMTKLAFGDRSEGVVAVIRSPIVGLAAVSVPDDALVVILEGVEKPGNLGAVLRSADGAGAHAVVAASPRTDLANPNAIRASAGTIFALPVAAATSEAVLAWAREHELRIVATRLDADAESYTEVDLRGPVALVLGTEDEGLSETWRGRGIEAIRLPMRGIADSLNVSVTAAVLLYEARRQRDQHRPGGG
jgi:TrmH family RNA methyltransferase